ncbi:MAG: sugar phosphorylase [Gammaproteobacteria bacterium]|nr:sugar phosphorylase [Gammaproteobacteria bacterium]
MKQRCKDFQAKVVGHIRYIYPDKDIEAIAQSLLVAMQLDTKCKKVKPYIDHWDQTDVIAISYGDSIKKTGEKPLKTLHRFFDAHLKGVIEGIHILPFFPYSSDDGFSVIDYQQVNNSLGDWSDIEAIANDYKLMSDLVINHCSSQSEWFERFKQNKVPENEYFIDLDPQTDLSSVTRPRTNPLLREVETPNGLKHVWCTFSHDQVDLNFANPNVLIEMVKIIHFYLQRGVKIFRLDAVAFLWKEIGTSCLNLAKTHEIVRLLRLLIEHNKPQTVIITETNIPNRENLAYFGNSNEAHVIYNFALPPLLLHGLITGKESYLNNWLMSMPPAQDGTTYLNFIASHDGIGLRPVEGILSEDEITQMVDAMKTFGGEISWRSLSDGEVRPYEINISLFSALGGTVKGLDQWAIDRFLCAHIIMLGLEGIPAFYIHSLLSTENDYEKLKRTDHSRSINRHSWSEEELNKALADGKSHHHFVFNKLKEVINTRKKQAAFHPNATQYTLHLGEGVFGFWRQSRNRQQSVFCIHNISDQTISISRQNINLIQTEQWIDLLQNNPIDELSDEFSLEPYQCMWLTNKCD